MKEKILIVEDDKHISKLVSYNLEKAGYDTWQVTTGEEAFKVLAKEPFTLIILDIMLPKMDGFEICRQLKQENRFKSVPIIMLTAKGEEVDRIVGLELGADDYMVKPFSPRELLLRIKAILKRSSTEDSAKEIITRGDIVINLPKHRVMARNKQITLTPMEFKLLVALLQRAGRVQTRERLLSDIWDINSDVYTRTVDTHIKRLREKLGPAGKIIETVRGLGYRCKEEDED